MKYSLSVGVLLLLITASHTLRAQDNGGGQAGTAFRQGVESFKAGQHQTAVDAFRKANQLNPSWKIQYNIGQCEAALKRYGLAIEAFEKYLGQGGDEAPTNRRDEVLTELDRLRRMVGNVRIQGEAGITFYVDGIKRASTPVTASILVTAGVEHWFWLVDTDGNKLLSVKETVSGGDTITLSLPGSPPPHTAAPPLIVEVAPTAEPQKEVEPEPQKEVEPEPEPTVPPEKEEPPAPEPVAETEPDPPEPIVAESKKGISPALFWVGTVATIAFGGGTLAMALVADSKWNDVKKDAKNNPWKDPDLDNGPTIQTVGYVFLGLTGAALITAVVAIPFTNWNSRKERNTNTALLLNPWATPDGGGLSFEGRF